MVKAAGTQTQLLTRGARVYLRLSSQQTSNINTHRKGSAVLKQMRPREGDSFQMSKRLTFTGLKKIIWTTKLKKHAKKTRIKLHMYCFLIKRIN